MDRLTKLLTSGIDEYYVDIADMKEGDLERLRRGEIAIMGKNKFGDVWMYSYEIVAEPPIDKDVEGTIK